MALSKHMSYALVAKLAAMHVTAIGTYIDKSCDVENILILVCLSLNWFLVVAHSSSTMFFLGLFHGEGDVLYPISQLSMNAFRSLPIGSVNIPSRIGGRLKAYI